MSRLENWVGPFTWIVALIHVIWQWLFFYLTIIRYGVPNEATFWVVFLTGAVWLVALIVGLVSLKRRGLQLLLTVLLVAAAPAVNYALIVIHS